MYKGSNAPTAGALRAIYPPMAYPGAGVISRFAHPARSSRMAASLKQIERFQVVYPLRS